MRFNFAASGVLIQQIAQGAPVDVFVSADQETTNRGVEQKLIDAETRKDFASNTVVLIAPAFMELQAELTEQVRVEVRAAQAAMA